MKVDEPRENCWRNSDRLRGERGWARVIAGPKSLLLTGGD